MAFFTSDFLQFFIDLAPNNNKEWFDANRDRYEQHVREPFKKFVQHLINEISKKAPEYKNLEPKDCIFRINRDIRFSKDKTPYKMMVSAVISPGGKKDKAINGIYFELGPEFLSVFAGVYEADKTDIAAIREGIAENISGFQRLYRDKKFSELYGEILGNKNKIIPKELKPAAEQEPLIFNKSWYFKAEFPAETILSEKLDKTILNALAVSQPIQEFFNTCIK